MCERITDPNCAKHDGTDCLECFYDPEKRTVIENYTYEGVSSDDRIVGYGSTVSKTLPDFYRQYYISTGICCPSRTYNDNGICVFIDIVGCKEG